jgi:hypothetical protein
MPVRGTLPVLVSVNTWDGPLVLPRVTPPKARVVGVRPALTTGATPVPVRVTGEPLIATLPVIVAEPVEVTSAVGEKTTLTMQILAGAKVVPQFPPAAPVGREKGAVITTVIPVSVPAPVLCSVRVREGELVVPVATFPNAIGPPVTLAAAGEGPGNSTAPMSNPGPDGRGFPKKSLGGAPVAVPLSTAGPAVIE